MPDTNDYSGILEIINGATSHEIVVGNIGTVLLTADPALARTTFDEYKKQSQTYVGGRAFQEDVTWFCDGEPAVTHYAAKARTFMLPLYVSFDTDDSEADYKIKTPKGTVSLTEAELADIKEYLQKAIVASTVWNDEEPLAVNIDCSKVTELSPRDVQELFGYTQPKLPPLPSDAE